MKLNHLMNEKKIKQHDLAELLNISRSAIYKYQQGKAEPSISMLIKIADYFDVSLDYLCERQNKNVIQTSGLSKNKKELLESIISMPEEQVYALLGYIARMQEHPIEKILNQIKNS